MNTTDIETKIKNELSWLQKHERLVLAVVAGLVLWFAIGKIDSLIANHDNANLQQAKVTAQVQEEKNQALAEQVSKDRLAYDALAAKIEARDAQLQQMQYQLVAALTKQQQTDKTMTPTELTQRWNVLVPEAAVSITNGHVTLPDSGARATVIELEKAPVLTQELSAKTEELGNSQALLKASGQQVTTLNDLVSGLQLKAVDDAKVCSAQIAVVKAEARKSKRRWFGIGFVTGFLARQYIKTATGL